MHPMWRMPRILSVMLVFACVVFLALPEGQAQSDATPGTIVRTPPFRWFQAGSGVPLPKEMIFENSLGRLGVLNADGPVNTEGHPFFEPLGINGRACVTCHQPANAMSLSAETIRERWSATGGNDPLFAAIDGSDNPALPQDKEASHSLLLKRG